MNDLCRRHVRLICAFLLLHSPLRHEKGRFLDHIVAQVDDQIHRLDGAVQTASNALTKRSDTFIICVLQV
jgi:hypothetical protein